uniref:Uncharacterized protein n=1 Tax=Strombidium inclinatum TaxID=197538 RepID=A0A7S3ITT6_9SPIT
MAVVRAKVLIEKRRPLLLLLPRVELEKSSYRSRASLFCFNELRWWRNLCGCWIVSLNLRFCQLSNLTLGLFDCAVLGGAHHYFMVYKLLQLFISCEVSSLSLWR